MLAEIIPEVMAKLPWPKSMRWKPGDPVRWVRPLHSILATFDGEVVPFCLCRRLQRQHTVGHRFLSKARSTVRRFDDYAAALKKAHVVLDAEERKAIIFEGVKQAAFVHGLEMIPDEGLLAEVAGLAEWPVVLIGTIEDQFMDVPAGNPADLDAHASEVFQPARSQDRQDGQPLRPGRQHDRRRRRQGNRRRQ